MLPEERDVALVWDIVNAAREIREFVKGCSPLEFQQNKMLRYAVERQILVIGEASRKLSDEFKQNHADIPWNAIIAQRHIIAHEYGEILTERIWNVAIRRIPELLTKLEPLVSNDEDKS